MKQILILILVLIFPVTSVLAVGSGNNASDPSDLLAVRNIASPLESGRNTDDITPVIAAVDCPAGALTESETCGDNTNNGCLMSPGTEQFETIACGDVYCGTYWSSETTRDLDWYELDFTANYGFLTFWATGEAPTRIWVYDAAGGCDDAIYMASIAAEAEDTAMLELELFSGTYWLVVGPDNWYNMPCDGSGDYTNNYVLSATCELGEPTISVDPLSVYGVALEGYSTTENIEVANTGAGRLEFTATSSQDFIATISDGASGVDVSSLNIEKLIANEKPSDYDAMLSALQLNEYGRYDDLPVIAAVDCPPDGIYETENCGESLNNGCAMDPGFEAFDNLTCNSSICGTVWSDSDDRDTDWYLLELTEATSFNWTVTADFPAMTLLLLPGDDPNMCHGYEALILDIADPGDTAKIFASLPAGDYWLWVGPTAWFNMPCDGTGEYTNSYVASLKCQPAWLSVDIVSGTIHQGQPPVDITVLLDATNLTSGTYTGNIRFRSNDYANDPLDVPVEFLVRKVFEYTPGDANMAAGNWPPAVDAADVTYLVHFFLGHNSSCRFDGFFASADANGDCMITGGDVAYLVYWFRGINEPPKHCPAYPPMPPTEENYPECEIMPVGQLY